MGVTSDQGTIAAESKMKDGKEKVNGGRYSVFMIKNSSWNYMDELSAVISKVSQTIIPVVYTSVIPMVF